MGDRHVTISGEWTDHNMNTQFTPLAPGAPRRMHESVVTQRLFLLRLPLDPVYVEDMDGTEVVHYREADMVMGRPYRFRWYGEEFAALRSEAGVELLKRLPDGK